MSVNSEEENLQEKKMLLKIFVLINYHKDLLLICGLMSALNYQRSHPKRVYVFVEQDLFCLNSDKDRLNGALS